MPGSARGVAAAVLVARTPRGKGGELPSTPRYNPTRTRTMSDLAKLFERIAIIALVALAILYACDYALFQHKMSKNGGADALGSVTSYYGTALKDGKMEIFTDQPQLETCAHSLFPHSGYRPCWYAARNNVKPIG